MESIIRILNKFGYFHRDVFIKIQIRAIKNYVTIYDRDSNMLKMKPSVRRKFTYFTVQFILVITAIKYYLLCRYQSEFIQSSLSEFFNSYTQHYRILYTWILMFLVMTIFCNLLIFIFEIDDDDFIPKFLHNLSLGDLFYKLTQPNSMKLFITGNTLYLIYNVFTKLTVLLYTLIFLTGQVASLLDDLDILSTQRIMFFTIQLIISVQQFVNCFYYIYIFSTLSIQFLLYKLNEIIISIRSSYNWRNRKKFHKSLKQYDQFTLLVEQLRLVINIFIGAIYLLTPVLFAVTIKMINTELFSL